VHLDRAKAEGNWVEMDNKGLRHGVWAAGKDQV
jgi:hypothetical protein